MSNIRKTTQLWSRKVTVTEDAAVVMDESNFQAEGGGLTLKNLSDANPVYVRIDPTAGDAVAGSYTDQVVIMPEEAYTFIQHNCVRISAICDAGQEADLYILIAHF